MGLSRLQKVLLLVHNDEKESFIKALQDEAIIHITDLRESSIKKEYPELLKESEVTEKSLEDKISSVRKSIEYLKPFVKEKGSFFESFITQKRPVSESSYLSAIEKTELIDEVKKLEEKNSSLEREKASLLSKRDALLPWETLDVELEEITTLKKAESIAGVIERPSKDWKEKLKALPLDMQIVKEEPAKVWLIVSYLKEHGKDIKKTLGDIGFESISFEGFKGKPRTILEDIEKSLTRIEEELLSISKRAGELAEKIEQLFILYDYNSNSLSQKKIDNLGFSTREVFGIEGWIRKDDYKRLTKLTERFSSVSVSLIKPEQGESPPVELKNRKGFTIFEYITKLYAFPKGDELDPSPILGPLFIIFFALCMGDFCYGLIFAVISWLLLKKVRGNKNLIKIFIVAGIATMVVGALTGGWFGNLHELLPFKWFKTMRAQILKFGFDPVEKPMTFFYLALGIGFINVNIGIFMGFMNYLKNGELLRGVSEKLSWNIIWLSILMIAGSFFIPILSSLRIPLAIIVVVCVLLYLFGTKGMSFIERILGVYSGFMGTISDILSHERLMALGLVTIGLTTAINVLAQLASKLPIVCFILAPLIFIGGHLFSIGINVLGAYAHSLRLIYAEFFTKFYAGGGKPFKPFQRETKYIEVV